MSKGRRRRIYIVLCTALVILICYAVLSVYLPYHDEQQAIVLIEEMGGRVRKGTFRPWVWFGDNVWNRVDEVDLSDTQVGDADLEMLGAFRRLYTLSLNNTQISDVGMTYLSGLTSLKVLSVNGTMITDVGVLHVSNMRNLVTVDFGGTQITDAALAHFGGCTHLNYIDLASTHITGTGFARLSEVPIYYLNLAGAPVSAPGVDEIARMESLQSLILVNTKVDATALARLVRDRPQLEIYANRSQYTKDEAEMIWGRAAPERSPE
jgi:hypothetical protein